MNNNDSPKQYMGVQYFKEKGFEGFISVKALLHNKMLDSIPKKRGVYAAFYEESTLPQFLLISKGGQFKGMSSTVGIAELEEKWVVGAQLVYVGKAGGPRTKTNLKKRIEALIRFGQGKKYSHRGGRYLWQLKDSDNLLLAYKVIEAGDPSVIETQLISQFINHYNKKPFANLVNGRKYE